jgi:hypothetical protein
MRRQFATMRPQQIVPISCGLVSSLEHMAYIKIPDFSDAATTLER